mgnify:CR=1 FL=1
MSRSVDEKTDLANLKILRVLRALRLIKLVRLIKASRMLQRWEIRIAVNYAYLAMILAFIETFFVAHLFACIWGLQVAPTLTLTPSLTHTCTTFFVAPPLCVPLGM